MKNTDRNLTWAEIDLAAIRHNYRRLQRLARLQGAGLLPVIKADAYGHGMLPIAAALQSLGARLFGVSDLAEGTALRESGFKSTILLLESPLPSFAGDVVAHNLTPAVSSRPLAVALNACARRLDRRLNIHVKIDTGMGRLGVWHEEAAALIRRIAELPHLKIDGIFTHFPLADRDRKFTQTQIRNFSDLLDSLGTIREGISYVHAANSMGLSGYNIPFLNLARPGLMLYGLYPTEAIKKKIRLKPAMSVKTRVLYVKPLSKGRGVSYGHTFVARKNMTAATLAIGYSDGYFRCVSNKSSVIIRGQRCPVIGNVTMDQIVVDVSKVKSVNVGDQAVVLGKDSGKEISAEELAGCAGTINYEIVCNLGNRLPRRYIS